MKIYLIAGYAGSGKSTAGQILAEHLAAETTAFAAAVKDDVAAAYNIPRDALETQEGKRAMYGAKSGRQLLIEHSAEMKRQSGETVWAVRVAEQLKASVAPIWVIHDWRYKAELQTLRSWFADAEIVTIRVQRDGVIPLSDPSEHDLDDFSTDYLIQNNGTLTDLRTELIATNCNLAC
jgi:hypothetical protein